MSGMERYKSPECPYCGAARRKDKHGGRIKTCGAAACQEQVRASRTLQRSMWGGGNVHPNSLAAKFDTQQRKEFTEWLKGLDRDLGAIERWAKTTA